MIGVITMTDTLTNYDTRMSVNKNSKENMALR